MNIENLMIYNVTPTDTSETGMGDVKNLFQVEKSPKKVKSYEVESSEVGLCFKCPNKKPLMKRSSVNSISLQPLELVH